MNGYRAVLLGSGTTLDDMRFLEPQELATPEGSLILMELHFADFPTQAAIDEINIRCAQAGVIPWPGNLQIAFADPSRPVIALQWVKAIAWMSIIIGALVLTLLPVLLGGLIWLIIPQAIKDLITMAGMMLLMVGVMKMIMPMMQPLEREKKKLPSRES